jgi:hypothetical protein
MEADDRRDLLRQCPNSGLSPGAIGELAAYGQNSQADKLDDYLNAQLCTPRRKAAGFPCREPRPDDCNTLCRSYYAELTIDAPPKLIGRCQRERDDSGVLQSVCSYLRVEASCPVGSFCEDKPPGCEEHLLDG